MGVSKTERVNICDIVVPKTGMVMNHSIIRCNTMGVPEDRQVNARVDIYDTMVVPKTGSK